MDRVAESSSLRQSRKLIRGVYYGDMKLTFLLSFLLQTPFYWENVETQLIAPIFPQIGGLDSTLLLISNGRGDTEVSVREFRENGDNNYSATYPHGDDQIQDHDGGVDIAVGRFTDNGWLLVTIDNPDQAHAVVRIGHETRSVEPFVVQTFRPGPGFWMLAERSPGGQTGVSIVNPTGESQRMSVEFVRWDLDGTQRRHSEVVLGPYVKHSRFLSELVDLDGVRTGDNGVIQGVLRIRGETRIAVAALQYSKRTDWFRSVIVSPYPTPDR